MLAYQLEALLGNICSVKSACAAQKLMKLVLETSCFCNQTKIPFSYSTTNCSSEALRKVIPLCSQCIVCDVAIDYFQCKTTCCRFV